MNQLDDSRQADAQTTFSEVFSGNGDDFCKALGAEFDTLQKRWENGFSGKDFQTIGEGYLAGRLSLICDFHLTVGPIPHQLENPPSFNPNCHKTAPLVVHIINKAHVSDLRDGDGWNDQIMLVDVVGLPDLPETKIPSLVRLYDGEKLKGYQGERLHYASIGWGFLSWSGRHKGLTQSVPSFIGWESYARRVPGLCEHQSRHDVVHSGGHAVESIANSENNILRDWCRDDAKEFFSSLRVTLFNDFAKFAIGVDFKPMLRLTNVAIGPIDF